MDNERREPLKGARLLIIGLLGVIVVLGLAVIILAIGRGGERVERREVDALAGSNDECVTCHRQATPGIVRQYGHSTMAAAEVGCRDCHEVAGGYPGSA
ncbi:MAG: hypothetical protein PVG79_15545, partial [Gemmatimonadales bacterium]